MCDCPCSCHSVLNALTDAWTDKDAWVFVGCPNEANEPGESICQECVVACL